MLLKALEKHLPDAHLLLEEGDEFPQKEIVWEDFSSDVLCVYGVSGPFYVRARAWLDEVSHRRLMFVEERGEALAALLRDDEALLLLNDPQVKLFFLQTPLQIGSMAKKIAWSAVFQEMRFVDLRGTESAALFQKELERIHLAANLLLSEASDWDRILALNARANRSVTARSGLALKDKFQGIPALIVGAGPSLKKNRHLLEKFEERALIFAAGSALNLMPIEPHFGASIDKEAPHEQFKQHPFRYVPFCFQSRANPDNVRLMEGEKFLFPDGSSPWINWINDQEVDWEAGWTVGNFLTATALLWGCNPIILVGMDFCYEEGQKYADLEAPAQEGLVKVIDREGKEVWTQRDWLMAAQFTEELARKFPDRLFIQASERGLKLASPVLTETLADVLQRCPSPKRELSAEAPQLPSSQLRWEIWEASLLACQTLCQNPDNVDLEALEKEIVYQKLLLPLWQVWRPVFEREVESDLQPRSFAEKMQLHQILFFQQVLKDHIHG